MLKSTSSLKNTPLSRLFISGAYWSFLGKMLGAAATLAVNVLLARLLSPEDMGSYFLALSLVSILAICGQWGLNRGLVKLIASESPDGGSDIARSNIIASFIIVSVFSIFIVSGLYSPAGHWMLTRLSGSEMLASISLLLGVWILIKAVLGLVSETFRGFHQIHLATMFDGLLSAFLSMVLIFIFWLFDKNASLEQMLQLIILAAGVSLFIGSIFVFLKIKKMNRGGGIHFSKILTFGFPLFLTSITLYSVRELHIWVLAIYQPESEVALYGSALRLVTLLTMPLLIVNSVIPPIIAGLYSQKKYSKVQSVLQKTATLMSCSAFTVSIVIFVFGSDILGFVYGEHYREAYMAFLILTAGQLLNVLTGSPGILLTMSGHERFVMKTAFSTGVVGVVVSILGAQEYGVIGAALGYSTGVVLLNLMMWLYSYKKLSIRTHGSLLILREMIYKFRLKLELDRANAGPFSSLDKVISAIEEFWWKIRGYTIIECFGDSHVSIFRGINYKDWAGKKRFRTVSVRGATAYGMGNPNSKTNALQVFQDRLDKIPKSRTILFMMGEVDAGFLVWLRSQKKGIDPFLCMEDARQRYTKFLSNVILLHSNIVVCSVPLPTIVDGENIGDVANARSEITANQQQRTDMTLMFNSELKEWTIKNSVKFMDFDSGALDQKTMLVKKKLLNKNAIDHHYDSAEFYLLIKKLVHNLD